MFKLFKKSGKQRAPKEEAVGYKALFDAGYLIWTRNPPRYGQDILYTRDGIVIEFANTANIPREWNCGGVWWKGCTAPTLDALIASLR